jgi:hypothetical protein
MCMEILAIVCSAAGHKITNLQTPCLRGTNLDTDTAKL